MFSRSFLTNPFICTGLLLLLFTAVASVYFRYTYLFEYTSLASTIRPLHRSSCHLPRDNGYSSNSHSREDSLKFGIIMLYDSPDNSTKAWTDNLLAPLVENRQAYCNRHNYTLIDANPLMNSSRPAAWSKLLAMDHHFQKDNYDYLMFLDMDTIIMNPDIKLESFVEASGGTYDLIMTEDDNGLNSGVFLARNTPWTLWFLRTAWEQEQLVPTLSTNGQRHPFRWEQRAFHYMTNSPTWQAAKLPPFEGYEAVRKNHIYILPQCAFNSYILHPLDFHSHRESSQYAPGDFLIHFAGKRGESKKKLMTHYLQETISSKQQIRATQLRRR